MTSNILPLPEMNHEKRYRGTCISGYWNPGIGKYIKSYNPATGEELGEVECGNEVLVHSAITTAHLAHLEWREVPAPVRGEFIRRVGNALREHKEELGKLVSMETGKILQEGLGEVQEMIDIADFAVGQSRMMYGNTMHSERPEHRMYEQWHPLGVVAVISAFNFPVAVWAWNAFLAVITGNTVVWKPSPKAPLCALAVHNICEKIIDEMKLPSLFQLINTDQVTDIEYLIEHPQVPLISFTGSTAVGRQVNQLCAMRFKKTILELGGNNAIILDRDCNMDLAIPAIVFGAVGTAGQRCTSTRRVFVPDDMMADIIDRLVAAYKQVKIGDPLEDDVLMGPLIDEQAVDNYKITLEEVQEEGGVIQYGGNVIKDNFVEPTIVVARHDMKCVKHETFAPIVYLIAYGDIDDAIKMQNDVPQGLSSAIFTNNIQNAEKFLSAKGSDCGIANVNIGTSGAEIGGAFGGEKETGGGRESGSDAWKGYMRRQTNTINYGNELPLAQGIKFDL